MLSLIAQPQMRITVAISEQARSAGRSAEDLALEALESGWAFREDPIEQPDEEFDLAAWVQAPTYMRLPRVTAEAGK